MTTNVAVDPQLLAEAQRAGGQPTKRATVTEALREYIQHRKQSKIIELFNTVEFDPKYDYKKQRRKS
jgi:Arc/MetJ family transcription regulator